MLRPLEMLAVVQDLARAAFLHATTSAADVSGADPNFLRPTTLHGHAARSSRTKTFPVTSTASFCSSAFNFVGFRVTRGTLARALVTPAELAIDNAKEAAWMEMYDHDRDTLEDILYRRLQDLWAPITDSMKVFDANGAAQPLCAQKVWEALLTAFPLDHNTCRLFCLLVKLLA